MAHVVEYEEFRAVEERLREAEKHIDFLVKMLLGQQWLSRAQAMRALNVSRMTLHRLTKAGRLTHRYEGSRPQYSITSLRDYMNGQKIEATPVDQRLILACARD